MIVLERQEEAYITLNTGPTPCTLRLGRKLLVSGCDGDDCIVELSHSL